MLKKFEVPGYLKSAFNCSNCSAYSNHIWECIKINETTGRLYSNFASEKGNDVYSMQLCKCSCCGYVSFWYKNKLIYPLNSYAEPPLSEMPDDIKNLYLEASNILELSPKGACAILRLALQILCNRLAGLDEKCKIDTAIKTLVENGLPSALQKAMDTVRIVGDEAVHPGEIVLDDNKDLAVAMFSLINIIIEKMIVEPIEIEKLYELMPNNKLEGIKNRDKKSIKTDKSKIED